MKRILLLSTIFYPAPYVGSVRITNWARMLPALGYQPLVICRDYGYRASLESLAENVHSDVKVMQLKGNGEPAPAEDSVAPPTTQVGGFRKQLLNRLAAASLHKWIIPESQMLFWNRVYPMVLRKAREYEPDVVLATAPAFSVLEMGRRLKRDLGVPFVADYRDSMVPDVRFRPKGIRKIQWPWFVRFERRIYEEADAILHAVPLQGRWARLRYCEARKRCVILRHFVPDDLLQGTIPTLPSKPPGRRYVSVVGFIRPQVVNLLAEAIRELVEVDSREYDLELRLIGRMLDDPEPVKAILGPRVTITGRLRHELAKQEIASSDVLINAITEERQQVIGISSKLYEYAAARRPIIAINPTRSDRLMLRELDATVIERPTVAAVREALRESLSMSGDKVEASYQDFLESQSRRQHSQRLGFVLDHVTGTAGQDIDFRELDSLIEPQAT